MAYNLFLDDVRQPGSVGNYINPVSLGEIYRKTKWVIVRNYSEFIHYINENGLPELISFDHDLAAIHYDPSTWVESFEYDEETGLDCAKWLCEYCLKENKRLPKFMVHSQNPVGKQNIKNYLENFKKHTK